MAAQRVKLDYNHLMEQIDGVLADKAEDNDTLVFGIVIGLELLSAYIRNIAERAIEINDETLIELLKDMCILKEKGGASDA